MNVYVEVAVMDVDHDADINVIADAILAAVMREMPHLNVILNEVEAD